MTVVNLESDYAYAELEENRYFNRAGGRRGDGVGVKSNNGATPSPVSLDRRSLSFELYQRVPRKRGR